MPTQHVERFHALVVKKITGELLSPEEEAELTAWLERSDENKAFLEEWNSENLVSRNTAQFRELKEWGLKQPNSLPAIPGAGRRVKLLRMWVAAASIVVVGLLTYVFLLLPATKESESQKASTKNQQEQGAILPARQQAVLTVSGVGSFSLDSVPDGKILEGALKTAEGSLQYESDGEGQKITEHRVSTPAGGYFNVTLPDGTKVWLNAATDLVYQSVFSGKERKVRLTGEAFFMVSKRNGVPFVIETKAGEVTVLGTHFNVKSYDKEVMTTSLLEGKVKVKDGVHARAYALQPGNQVKINPVTGAADFIEEGDVESAVGWKSGYFSFGSGAALPEVLKEIERWYNVKVIYNGSAISKVVLGGSFERNLELADLLKKLEFVTSARFSISDNSIIVQP